MLKGTIWSQMWGLSCSFSRPQIALVLLEKNFLIIGRVQVENLSEEQATFLNPGKNEDKLSGIGNLDSG